MYKDICLDFVKKYLTYLQLFFNNYNTIGGSESTLNEVNQLLSSQFPVRAFKIKIEPLHLRTSTIQVTTCDSLERNFKWKKKELGERVPTKFMNSFYHSFESILLWMKSNGVAIFCP